MILSSSLLFSTFAGFILIIIAFIYHKLALFFYCGQLKKMELSTMEITAICGQSVNNEEVIKLREELRKCKEQNEHMRQKLYEGDRSKSLYQGMCDEGDVEAARLLNEILGQNQQIQTSKYHIKKMAAANLNYNDLQEMYSNQIRVLTEKIDLSLKKQKEENIEVDKITINEFDDSDSNKDKYLKDNDELKENTLSKDKISEDKVSEINELEKKKSHLYHLVEELKETLDFEQCQLQINNDVLKTLTEEVALIESQHEAQKSQPLPDGSRGNGLFCELDENRISLIQKTKQLEKAYHETKISLAKSSSKLKNLLIQDAEALEEMKNKNLQMMVICDTSNISSIKNLDEKHNGLQVHINEAIYKIYPNLIGPSEHFMSYKINKAWEDLNLAQKELTGCSSNMHTIAEELYVKQINLLDVQKAFLLEEVTHSRLVALIQEYKRAEPINPVQHNSSSTSSVETKENETDNTNSLTGSENFVEASKPDKQKKRAPIKFICKQIKVNMSDFD